MIKYLLKFILIMIYPIWIYMGEYGFKESHNEWVVEFKSL